MIKQIDHIGIAVKSLENSLPFYTDILKLSLEGIETVENQGVKVAFILAGNTRLEILEALSDESPIAKFIEMRGEGIHHIALGVEDIDGRIEELKSAGVKMINDTAKPGAHGAQIAFMHPKSASGVLYELCEKPEATKGDEDGHL